MRKITTPIGELTIASDGQHITRVSFRQGDSEIGERRAEGVASCNAVLDLAEAQLQDYFDGKLQAFDLPLNPGGTAFQRIVWQRCAEIPFGQAMTYGQLAADIGKPKASRAVGAALGANPLWIVVPCHRVLGANGSLTRFAGGLDVKK